MKTWIKLLLVALLATNLVVNVRAEDTDEVRHACWLKYRRMGLRIPSFAPQRVTAQLAQGAVLRHVAGLGLGVARAVGRLI